MYQFWKRKCFKSSFLEQTFASKIKVFLSVTGIFTDIGVLLVVLNYSISVTGFSFWMALISSLFFYMAGGLIELDLIRKGQIEDIILQGEPIKGGILIHICGSGRSDRPITPPVSPTGEAALEDEDNIAYQTPRAKAVIKDRPSSVVFVPLPDIEQQQRKRDSTGSRGMRLSVTDFSPEEPPPPYSLSENRTETPRKKKTKKWPYKNKVKETKRKVIHKTKAWFMTCVSSPFQHNHCNDNYVVRKISHR